MKFYILKKTFLKLSKKYSNPRMSHTYNGSRSKFLKFEAYIYWFLQTWSTCRFILDFTGFLYIVDGCQIPLCKVSLLHSFTLRCSLLHSYFYVHINKHTVKKIQQKLFVNKKRSINPYVIFWKILNHIPFICNSDIKILYRA